MDYWLLKEVPGWVGEARPEDMLRREKPNQDRELDRQRQLALVWAERWATGASHRRLCSCAFQRVACGACHGQRFLEAPELPQKPTKAEAVTRYEFASAAVLGAWWTVEFLRRLKDFIALERLQKA